MINGWLDKFKNGWLNKDVDTILSLFDEKVEYWETPNKKVDVDGLENEWQAIRSQDNINLELSVFSSHDNRHTIKWRLSYIDQQTIQQNWAGIYLIELNDKNICTYFYQTGEKM